MAKHVLILDADELFARQLVTELAQVDTYSTMIAPTTDVARRILTRKYQDVTFISAALADQDAITMLRTLQPDLRLILTVPTSQYRISDTLANRVQGILIKPLMQMDLRPVLNAALKQPVWVRGTGKTNGVPPPNKQLDTAVLISILQRANLGQLVQTAVFSQGENLLAYWGDLTEEEASQVARRAFGDGELEHGPVQIQFVSIPPKTEETLLYTRLVSEDYWLTLTAVPETPLRELRLRAEKLCATLLEALHGKVTIDDENEVVDTGLLGQRRSFAIVWRPLRPLPKTMLIPLRRVFERLSAANACVMTHHDVQPDLVHLVVLCPPGHDSLWAAYLYKNGSEAIIQQEYGIHATLWEAGYYATETTEPLPAAELSLFLETDKSVNGNQ